MVPITGVVSRASRLQLRSPLSTTRRQPFAANARLRLQRGRRGTFGDLRCRSRVGNTNFHQADGTSTPLACPLPLLCPFDWPLPLPLPFPFPFPFRCTIACPLPLAAARCAPLLITLSLGSRRMRVAANVCLCVATMTVVPFAAACSRRWVMIAAFSSSIELRGSSARSTFGRVARARAIAMRCRSPAESWWAYALRLEARPTDSRASMAR